MDFNDIAQAQNPDFDPQQYAKQKYRQQLGTALMKAGIQGQPQGQDVSGHFVAPSIFQRLNPVAQMVGGQNMAQKAQGNVMATDLANQRYLMSKYGQQPQLASVGQPANYGLTDNGSVLAALLRGMGG